jgi:hypothetical protein
LAKRKIAGRKPGATTAVVSKTVTVPPVMRPVRREAALFFLALALVYIACPIITSSDSHFVIPTALSIVRHGDANIDEYAQRFHETPWAVWRKDQHTWNVYPIGVPWMILPAVWLADRTASVLGRDFEALVIQKSPLFLELVLASTITASAATVLFVFARRRLSLPRSLLISALFALGTPAFSSASRGLWSHGPAMLLLSTAVLLYDSLKDREFRKAALLGLVCGYSYSVRPSNMLLMVGFAVLIALTALHHLPWYACGAILGLSPFFVFNLMVHGIWTPPYYALTQGVIFAGPLAPFKTLYGLLLSPSRGLLVFSPFLLAVLARVWPPNLRLMPFTRLEFLLSLLALAWCYGTAKWPLWWGGGSLGPRLLCDLLPCVFVLFLPVVANLSLDRSRGVFVLTSIFVIAGALSIAIHLRCATSTAVALWNATPIGIDQRPERAWDWSDPQFLRGLGSVPW